MRFEAVVFDQPVRLFPGSSSATSVQQSQLKQGASIVIKEFAGKQWVTLDGVPGAWLVGLERVVNAKPWMEPAKPAVSARKGAAKAEPAEV